MNDISKKTSDIENLSIKINGLAELLSAHTTNTVGDNILNDAQNLSWSYECLAILANNLAEKISEISP